MDNTELIPTEIFYPESDGKPMADNSVQWDWMVMIVEELKELFDETTVTVAGNMFWYPVEGNPKIVVAPDAYVIFGRPDVDRGSYKQWEEDGIAPQVVFEVLSPANTPSEMEDKREFYEHYGVEEFYIVDPYEESIQGFIRSGDELLSVEEMDGFVSPRLGVRFELGQNSLTLFDPSGRQFVRRKDRVRALNEEQRRTEAERDEAQRRAAEQAALTQKYLAKLKELGIDPDSIK
jgi:Uma2 family endonuclease